MFSLLRNSLHIDIHTFIFMVDSTLLLNIRDSIDVLITIIRDKKIINFFCSQEQIGLTMSLYTEHSLLRALKHARHLHTIIAFAGHKEAVQSHLKCSAPDSSLGHWRFSLQQ